jgi:hypothetical protein
VQNDYPKFYEKYLKKFDLNMYRYIDSPWTLYFVNFKTFKRLKIEINRKEFTMKLIDESIREAIKRIGSCEDFELLRIILNDIDGGKK